MNTELHVIFGAGQVGRPLAQRLRDAGQQVRVVKRSPGGAPPGVESLQGDAADAARGAATIYHCLNPPYNRRVWAELVPRYMENLIAAAARTGARLVVLDNVYILGRPAARSTRRRHPTPAAERARSAPAPPSASSRSTAAVTYERPWAGPPFLWARGDAHHRAR